MNVRIALEALAAVHGLIGAVLMFAFGWFVGGFAHTVFNEFLGFVRRDD